MDSYSPVSKRLDLLTDFFYLAMSIWLFPRFVQGDSRPLQAEDDQKLRSRESIRSLLSNIWTFGDIFQISRGRLTKAEANALPGRNSIGLDILSAAAPIC